MVGGIADILMCSVLVVKVQPTVIFLPERWSSPVGSKWICSERISICVCKRPNGFIGAADHRRFAKQRFVVGNMQGVSGLYYTHSRELQIRGRRETDLDLLEYLNSKWQRMLSLLGNKVMNVNAKYDRHVMV